MISGACIGLGAWDSGYGVARLTSKCYGSCCPVAFLTSQRDCRKLYGDHALGV